MYTPDFLSKREADLYFDVLSKDLNWERRDHAPRSEYWTNIYGREYTYGRGSGKRTYQSQEEHHIIQYIDAMLGNYIRGKMYKKYLRYYEGCFLNKYEDGSDGLGWHADDDPGIDHSRPIAIITLGQARVLQTKAQVRGSHPESQLLEHGSLFLMPAGFQFTHFHRIPRDPSAIGTRISLTYRGLI